MYMPPDTKLRLDPRDEYTHAPEAASNYNESMYFNAFDTARGIGLWLRLGNRPNEGHAEMTCCVYLPDGRVGFMYRRPEISGNESMDAGGMRFEVLEPFKRLRVSYEGELLMMDDPLAMANPSAAFKRYPQRPARIELEFEGISPMHGGEIVSLDGMPIELDPAKSVYRGHTEQHMAVRGHVTVDGTRHEIDGTGYRDKSWGPRFWHSFYWYKWLPVAFDNQTGVLLSIKGDPQGGPDRVSGNLLRGGAYEPVTGGRIEVDYDETWVPRTLVARIVTAGGECEVRARILSTVPLRHKAAAGADPGTYTRITESIAEYSFEGRKALGMVEFCDRMRNSVPISASVVPAKPHVLGVPA